MPVWHLTIDLTSAVRLYKTGDDIPETAEKAVEIIEACGWLASTKYPTVLRNVLDRLKLAETSEEYVRVFDEIYDLADFDRVWIETS